ncbi:HK97-gp10 family putative phage morphogenesis protein [Dactylosporangium maewongense]
MRSTPDMQSALEEIGDKVKAQAERLSPVVTGRYRASWYRTTSATSTGLRLRIGNRAPYARYLEFGTSEIQAQRVLGRSLDAINLA